MAPMAGTSSSNAGAAQARVRRRHKPTRRGGGGTVETTDCRARRTDPHYAGGTKDQDASRIFDDSLAGSEILEATSSLALGGRDPHARQRRPASSTAGSATCKLKQGVTWHDGKPFSADDVVFTAAYAGDRRRRWSP